MTPSFKPMRTELREIPMSRPQPIGAILLLAFSALTAGCNGGPKHMSDVTSTQADAGQVPEPMSEHPECILSADCPSGLHCDLGECVQDCNTDVACSANLSCSSRGRCLAPTESDEDPAPPSKSTGTLDVSPTFLKLTRDNSGKTVQLYLSTDSPDPVRYRVQVDAPYLTVNSARGSFTKQGSIALKVDTSNIVARDIAGSITLYTTLGSSVVSLPLHAGLTGEYQATLRYNGGAVPLGDTQLDLQMMENNGDISVRVVPENSMLFPPNAHGNDAAYGFGSHNSDGSIDLTIEHLLDANAAGSQNHFGRSIGRRLILHLTPSDTGAFEGTFSESIYGLFENPTSIGGTARFEFHPGSPDPNFQTKNVIMPSVASNSSLPLSAATAFKQDSPCPNGSVSTTDLLQVSYNPLRASVLNAATLYSDLSAHCRTMLGIGRTSNQIGSADSAACGSLGSTACVMGLNAAGNGYSSQGADQGALAQALVAPAALVAQEELIEALRDSIVDGKGVNAELTHYDTALSAIAPVAQWLMQPGMLEFARNIPASAASTAPSIPPLSAAEAAADNVATTVSPAPSELAPYPMARALARIVELLVDVNAERQRVVGASTNSDTTTPITQAQQNALITYLDAVALMGVLSNWAVAPPDASASVTGVITKLNHAFADLVQGAGDTLGSPAQHIPFVYRPAAVSSGITNFEQQLTIAGQAVTQLQTLETAYTSGLEQIDQTSYQTQLKLEDTSISLGQQITNLCGADFNLNPTGSVNWTKCGATSGTVAELTLEIQQAEAAEQTALAKIQDQRQKIAVDTDLVAQKQNLRSDELTFLSSSGQQIVANTFTDGMLSAAQSALSVGSEGNLFNAFGPEVAAGVTFMIGEARAGLEADNASLEQAQNMKTQQTNADVEYADGLANIQREDIDMAEMVVEQRQSVIGRLESQLKLANSVAQAQQLYASLGQSKQLTQSNPYSDPAYRNVNNKLALALLDARATAQQELLAAGRALEYEINQQLPTMPVAVQSARNKTTMGLLQSCLDKLFNNYNAEFGSPQQYSTTVSIRKLFGISGQRVDEVTGETLSEGEQFRAYVLKNQSLQTDGTLRIQFSTNLMSGNGLWSTDVCNDKITEVDAQLVGDFLGDNEATIQLSLSGGSVLRACDVNELRSWNLDSNAEAVIQTGVNTFGDVTNTSLYGQAVARATWTLDIKGAKQEPSNADVDVTKLDDIILKIKHQALPLQSSGSWSLDDSCLANVINY